MRGELYTDAQKRTFLRRMNMPLRVFVGLILSLGTMVLFGATTPAPWIWAVEIAVLLVMVVVTMLYSMEVMEDLPLMRMWSVVGFAWLCILFGLVMVDYLTRGRFPM
jgi:caa(3)-type oxidase subunit IV